MPTRRDFITAGATGLAALSVPSRALAQLEATAVRAAALPAGAPRDRKPRALSILILGGTSFFGPHQIKYALDRGHSVSTFTRGRTAPTIHPELFAEVESLVGDRENDLTALEGRTWDVVIDNSGRQAEWTKDSAELLKDSAEFYLYTSSTGVFYPYLGDDIDETTDPVLELPAGLDPNREGAYGYGMMKANSELEARRAFGDDRTIVVRPTYVLGPGDRTDRFAHWPVRLSMGGEVLIPGNADDPAQYIDVRDLSEWMIRLLEEGRAGTYNAAGPGARTGITRFVHGAHAAFGSSVDFVQVDDYDFLREQGVSFALPWLMPVGPNYGAMRINNDRALANGLTFRPLATTIRDVYHWWNSDAVEAERRDGWRTNPRSLLVREPEILAAWKARG